MSDPGASPEGRQRQWTTPERVVLVLAVGQALALALFAFLADALRTSYLSALAVFFLWSVVVGGCLLAFLRARRAGAPLRVLSVPMLAPVVALIGFLAWIVSTRWGAGTALLAGSLETVRLAAILAGVGAFFLYFLGHWADAVARGEPDAALLVMVRLNRMGIAAQLLIALALFLRLYGGGDWVLWVGRAVTLATLVVLADAAAGVLLEIYRPEGRRGQVPPGRSMLLEWALTRSNPVRRVSEAIEETYGIRLGEIWAVRFVGRMIGPLALAGLLLAWLSSCVTVIPVECEGVRVRLGRLEKAALPPGAHLSLPWPFGRIVVVATRRTEMIHLGYDEDLGGPILWNERHYRGERNMLTGNGEELLTISVLVHYRIADPAAHLLGARAPRDALVHIAHRELVHLLAARESFRVMLDEREEIAARLRKTFQAAADRFGFGLEIQFVGLRDIHPPVEVAPAFHAVVSAEQKRYAIVHGGERYRSLTLPRAEATASKLRRDATARGEARVAAGKGEAARFGELAGAFQVAPGPLRERAYLETMETMLPGRPKLVFDGEPPRDHPPLLYLPLDPGYSTVPVLDDPRKKE